MYLLMSISDLVQILPADLNRPTARCIEDYINKKYADKVLHKVGLCVGFHSIISISEGHIAHGTGIVNVNVKFRMVVYRPFRGEIINATITHSRPATDENDDSAGVWLSQDFFEDINVPPKLLFEPTEWKNNEETFVFTPDKQTDEGIEVAPENESTQFYFDRTDKCLVRVEDETFIDTSPELDNMNRPIGFLAPEQLVNQHESERKTPYLIRGSMCFSGLGPTHWWMAEEPSEDQKMPTSES